MEFKFPDKATLAEMFSDEEKPSILDGIDVAEVLALGMAGLKLAIEEARLPEYKSIQEIIGLDPGYVLDRMIVEEGTVPCVSLACDEGYPVLHLRIITDEGDLIAEAGCNLIGPTGFFASQAYSLITELKKGGSNVTDEAFKDFIVRKTANMLKAAFSKVKDRMEIAVQSFLDEVSISYRELWFENHAKFNSLQGIKIGKIRFDKQKREILQKHESEIRDLHSDESTKIIQDLKKKHLALVYDRILEHWKTIYRLQLEGRNWRPYVRADDMADITDDLIEDFEKNGDISFLALEHAARRVELFNIFGVSEAVLEKRRQGIPASGYSRAMLYRMRKEGRDLLKSG